MSSSNFGTGIWSLSGIRGNVALAIGLGLPVLLAPSLEAQATGTVTGQVVDAQTLAAISSAQVFLPALDLGALSRANGRYLIVNVPVGTHDISVARIGFGSVTQQVTVLEGESALVDFQLSEEVLGLDEIVVTGTAGQARRREVGNSIEQINLEDQVIEPVANVQGLLQGRIPGMNVNFNSGQVGDAAEIRLRGNVSIALSNQPLIYIDGIRVASEAYEALTPVTLGQQWGTFATPSPLNDINPDDIERIEVIKGAAATTLYGTEAASGVIQIFTKRGRGTDPVWEAALDQGVGFKNVFGPRQTLRGTPVENFPLGTSASGGTAKYQYWDPWMQNPHTQKYSTAVRGGVGEASYFLSGSYENNDDIFVTGGEEAYSVRGNVGVDVTESLNLDWNTSYTTRNIQNLGSGDNLYSLTSQHTYFTLVPVRKSYLDSLVFEPSYLTSIDRLTTGGILRYQPSINFTTRFTVGYDRAANRGSIELPFGHPIRREGFLSLTDNVRRLSTIELISTYTVSPSEGLSADLSGGFQRIERENDQVEGWTDGFPGPGEVTLSSGGVSLARQIRERVITGGVFGQAIFKLQDRYFVTVGVRADGNSAFGQDFGWQVYPKVSGSWVASDETFWPEGLGEMKVRAAWGTAGRAPGAFDAVRTWTPIPYGTQSVFIPRNVGNSELGPERTAEVELGFDGSAFDNRLDVSFTWYRQVTSDALLAVSQAPSLGNWASQLENVGTIENRGMEVAINATLVQGRDWNWDVGVDLSTNHSETLDIGDREGFEVHWSEAWLEVGQPVGVIRGTRILNPDEIAPPEVELQSFFGPPVPTTIISPRTTIQLPGGIALTARGEYQGGHYVQDGNTMWALRVGSKEEPACFEAYPLIDAGQIDQLTAQERLWCVGETFSELEAREGFVYPADFFKLRELSLRVPVDFAFPMASSASLTLSGRNLFRWVKDDFYAWDPENGGWDPGTGFSNNLWQQPSPPRFFTASLRVRF